MPSTILYHPNRPRGVMFEDPDTAALAEEGWVATQEELTQEAYDAEEAKQRQKEQAASALEKIR